MNIAIIDDLKTDSKLTAQYLNMYFSKYCSDFPFCIRIFESGEDFLFSFKRDSYDLIFIDYYMNGMTGLDTAFSIRQTDRSAIIIFTTSSRDFAIDSYKVKASGYLVKPISYNDISEILSLIDYKKIKDRQFIELISGYEKIRILLNDIIYCDISGHYVQVHTLSSGIRRCRMTFKEISDLLHPYPEFLMCYRGCIINMNHIAHIDDLVFFMCNAERIPFRKKEHNEIIVTYSNFLFNKARERNL